MELDWPGTVVTGTVLERERAGTGNASNYWNYGTGMSLERWELERWWNGNGAGTGGNGTGNPRNGGNWNGGGTGTGWNGNGVERGSRGTVGTGTVEVESALGALGYGSCQEPDSD